MKFEQEIIDEIYDSIEDSEEFLDFLQNGHLNESCIENGERVMYFEDGERYIAHGYRIGEFDGEKEKAIIDFYQELGGEYEDD